MAHLGSGELLIVLGTIGFTAALVPQVVRTWRLGHADDFSIPFILLVLGASAVTLAYWLLHREPWYVWLGFVFNVLGWGYILAVRLRPRVRPPPTPPAPGTTGK